MRVRRLSALFWAMCVMACLFILYVVIDLGFNLPSVRPAMQEVDDSKWALFESKLQRIENDLTQHHAVVGEIKTVMDKMAAKPKPVKEHLKKPKTLKEDHNKGTKVVGEEPPRMRPVLYFDQGSCPVQRQATSKADVQMLSMYERILFDDKDGGVWKQGWNIEYDRKQWSSKHKLKVFIVPHSHNDPGWLKTFENYYRTQTRAIFTNMVEKLFEGIGRKFIWAEISFLSLWWDGDATAAEKAAFKKLLSSGQLEIVTGGWVMNDEANSHWLSIAQQLTTGHQWLMHNLDYVPKNSWAIDPFGHSSTQPYLLKLAGFENSVIQRVHYRVKKELAQNRQLEFKWRQLWDSKGNTDMMTHMMPFYSYDAPHSCGPDPKVCCQFDFKRLPGNGVTCPWGAPPRKIIHKNVAERSELILDQWRKKAQLYRSAAVLVPLGDDFRYDRPSEWDQQFANYEMIIDYINNNDDWNAEVQFGTLEDYFKAVHEELKPSSLPVLTGDFFTYADRNQHYWSGYYTSRPFYKNMDRVLLGYLRSAEIITGQATLSKAVGGLTEAQLRDKVAAARRALALFQHHDGVTGTSRDDVRDDYAKKMHEAIRLCQLAIQQAAYHLLRQPTIQDQSQEDIYFDVDDIWRERNEIPSRITITLDILAPSRKVVLYNSLTYKRHEIVTVIVSNPNVEVYDQEDNPIMAQVSPVPNGETRLSIANNKFALSFMATIEPLALTSYTVSLRNVAAINKYTSYASVHIYNADYLSVDLPEMFAVEQPAARLADDLTIQPANGTKVVVNMNGLIKAIVSSDGVVTPVHMDFVEYESSKANDNNSGGYLFVPSGPARVLRPPAYPELVRWRGPLTAGLTAYLPHAKAHVQLTIVVENNPSTPHSEVSVTNAFLLDPQTDDVELALRLSTSIRNNDEFYTDLNGMQMIKRKYFGKLPLQANFYPLPSAAFIQDDSSRLTLLTSTPLGMAALQPGQIEVMQDRRLSRDDNRGLNQGITDNVRTQHQFRLIVEYPIKDCSDPPPPSPQWGALSVGAHISAQRLLHPLVRLLVNSPDARLTYVPLDKALPLGADVVLASLNAHVVGKTKEGVWGRGAGLTFQRVYLEKCFGSKDLHSWYPTGDGQIYLPDLSGLPTEQIYDSSLTFTQIKNHLPEGTLMLCPMEVRSVFLNHSATHEDALE